METMIYDPRIAHLETSISYGTLGLVDQIVRRTNDPISINSHDIVLINGGTIIRNCYDNNSNDRVLIEKINHDFKTLYNTIESYTSNNSIVLTYFHPNINNILPKHVWRKETPLRIGITKLITKMSHDEQLIPNKLVRFSSGDHMSLYGLLISQRFAYQVISPSLQTLLLKLQKSSANKPVRISMITHCPFDYFLLEKYPIKIILSHTGKILDKQHIPYKVFKDEHIPFNRSTYKLFGDKDFVVGLVKNKPKFMKLLQQNNINLKLKTEREIVLLAQQLLSIPQAEINWKI